jgi:LuxR family transcriptional regulator, maltose regulon positive regulatory protein
MPALPPVAHIVAEPRWAAHPPRGMTLPRRRLRAVTRGGYSPFVLMLDDLHELRSPACHDVLDLLISAIPPGSQLAVASRSEQPHVPRLRAIGDVQEFGPGDLALDSAGAQQVFANAHVSLTPELAAAVTEQTEGWPAGLYLAAVIARENNGQVRTVTGDDRYLADYLYREALTRQPEDIQRFLRRTAVLDQLYGSLCDAVLGSSASAGHLRHLEAGRIQPARQPVHDPARPSAAVVPLPRAVPGVPPRRA